MKKLLALAAVMAFMTSSVFAQDFSFRNFKLYGEGSIYGFAYENMTTGVGTTANVGGTAGYVTLGAMFDIYDNVTASFALGYSNLWGDDANFSLAGRPIDNNADDGYLNRIRVVEANIAFSNLFDVEGLSAKVGRQFYGDEDSLVMYLGIRRDQPLVINAGVNPGVNVIGAITSVDALTAYYDKGNIKANVIYGIIDNEWADGNQTLMGADFKYLNISDMFDAQAYFYNLENYVPGNTNYSVFGVKPSFKYENLKASLEFAKNFAGDNILSEDGMKTSNIIKLDASYVIESINLTPRAMYMVAGGEGKVFNTFGNYVPGLIVGQDGAGMGAWDDDQIINIGADYVLNKFTFSADYYNFAPRDGDWDAVNEIDAVVKYAYNESVDFRIGIGHFFGNDAMDYDSSTVQGGVTYKFK